jgi:hypothetical protein
VDTGFRIKIMLDQWRVFQEQFHEGAILQSSMPRLIFVARLSADEDDEQIETWMIGSGNKPSGSSSRHNASARGLGHDDIRSDGRHCALE